MKKIEASLIKRILRISSWLFSVQIFVQCSFGALINLFLFLILLVTYSFPGALLESVAYLEFLEKEHKSTRGHQDQQLQWVLFVGIELHVCFPHQFWHACVFAQHFHFLGSHGIVGLFPLIILWLVLMIPLVVGLSYQFLEALVGKILSKPGGQLWVELLVLESLVGQMLQKLDRQLWVELLVLEALVLKMIWKPYVG